MARLSVEQVSLDGQDREGAGFAAPVKGQPFRPGAVAGLELCPPPALPGVKPDAEIPALFVHPLLETGGQLPYTMATCTRGPSVCFRLLLAQLSRRGIAGRLLHPPGADMGRQAPSPAPAFEVRFVRESTTATHKNRYRKHKEREVPHKQRDGLNEGEQSGGFRPPPGAASQSENSCWN